MADDGAKSSARSGRVGSQERDLEVAAAGIAADKRSGGATGQIARDRADCPFLDALAQIRAERMRHYADAAATPDDRVWDDIRTISRELAAHLTRGARSSGSCSSWGTAGESAELTQHIDRDRAGCPGPGDRDRALELERRATGLAEQEWTSPRPAAFYEDLYRGVTRAPDAKPDLRVITLGIHRCR